MILITGGTGYVGGYVVRSLSDKGLRTRCLVRKKTYQKQFNMLGVELAFGDVTDLDSLILATVGIDICIHCVGILQEKKPHTTHQKIVVEGTMNLLNACVQNRVKKIIYLSGLGAESTAVSLYHQAKWKAEEMIIKSGLEYVIFRPSVIFGPNDDFINRFVNMIRFSPFLPMIGQGQNKMQPVSVHDVVTCIILAIDGRQMLNHIIEMGGPQQLTFREIMEMMLHALKKKRWILPLPLSLVEMIIPAIENLPGSPLSEDQLVMVKHDNITDNQKLHELFHVNLIPLTQGFKEYPWYRGD